MATSITGLLDPWPICVEVFRIPFTPERQLLLLICNGAEVFRDDCLR
jgi:hypothetical protein